MQVQVFYQLEPYWQYTVSISFVFGLIYYLIHACSFQTRRRVDNSHLHALASVIVPTKGCWRTRQKLFTLHKKQIRICLSMLLDGLLDGTIQLREPLNLENLICGTASAYGWSITLELDLRSCVRILRWMMKKVEPDPGVLYPLLSSNPELTLCLDFVAHFNLESRVSQFLAKIPNDGSLASIEFTVLAPNITHSFYNPQFMLSSLPVLARGTSMALHVTVSRILDLITTSQSQVVIECVFNGSKSYTKILNILADKLVDEGKEVIVNLGEKAWREQKLMAEWEIALLNAGYITRWAVILSKRSSK